MKQTARSTAGGAAVGWAELLLFSAVETDPALRLQAARLLGLPDLPPAYFDKPQGPGADSTGGGAAVAPAHRQGRHLQAPAFWVAQERDVPAPAEPVSSPASVAPWTAQDAHEVESWLQPSGDAVPVPPALWGNAHPIYRRIEERLRALNPAEVLDTARLMKRMAAAEWPWPLPFRPVGRLRGRLVILLDWAAPMRVFESDVADLYEACVQRYRGLAVEVDAWTGGPDGCLQSTGQRLNGVDWGRDVLLLLVSDAGGTSRIQNKAWRRWLHRASRRVGAIMVANPCQSGSAQVSETQTAIQLQTLLAALSPALTVEPGLVRAMRLALYPHSTARLESLVWAHPDLVGGLPRRKWRQEPAKAHLDHLAQLGPRVQRQVAAVLTAQRAGHHKVQRDEELARLSTVWVAASDPVAEGGAWAVPDFASALDGLGRVAQHLSHINKGDVEGANRSRLQASVAAQRRLSRLPTKALKEQPELLQWLMDAASQNGQGAAVPADLLDVLDHGKDTTGTAVFALYQQGRRLVLNKEVGTWSGYFRINQTAAEKADARAFAAAPKQRLWSFTVTGDRLWVSVGGLARQWMVDEFKRPLTVTTGLPAGAWGDVGAVSVRVQWRGGQVEAKCLKRPFGVMAWRQGHDGVFATVPVLTGEHLEIALNPDGTCGPHGHVPGVDGKPLTKQGISQFQVGIDSCGVYCTAAFFAPVAKDSALVRLRYIPPGTFPMGTPDGKDGDDAERPQHPVTLTEGLWLADTPCTQALWQAVMGSNPSDFKKGAEAPRRPVENVSHEDVSEFLRKLTALLPEGVEAVLPTEAQWERAARAGTHTAYWWGDGRDDSKANWYQQNKGTTPVDRNPPNPWGLYDMHGNVLEWCADGKRSYRAQAELNPEGDRAGDAFVVRGGSWFFHPDDARAAFRLRRRAGPRDRDLGFRFALRSSSPGPEGSA